MMLDRGCNWFCDRCGEKMNDQMGFTTVANKWTCQNCGLENDVSEKNIIPESGSKGYVLTKKYDDGVTERIRFTKTREVHDFDGPKGKMSVWSKRR